MTKVERVDRLLKFLEIVSVHPKIKNISTDKILKEIAKELDVYDNYAEPAQTGISTTPYYYVTQTGLNAYGADTPITGNGSHTHSYDIGIASDHINSGKEEF